MSMVYVLKLTKALQYALIPLLGLLLLIVGLRILDNSAVSDALAQSSGGAVLVIDAGHGGADGGAVAADGTVESVINLDICLKMRTLAAFCGQAAVLTRESEDIDYPAEAGTIAAKKVADQKARVALINSTENAVLISIHQNKYPDSRPRGSQALYAATDGSRELGELVHANLITALYPENRRVAAPIQDSIYLMKNISCPGILVECGFLSNPEESAYLKTDSYRLKLAVVILGSFLQYERGSM